MALENFFFLINLISKDCDVIENEPDDELFLYLIILISSSFYIKKIVLFSRIGFYHASSAYLILHLLCKIMFSEQISRRVKINRFRRDFFLSSIKCDLDDS